MNSNPTEYPRKIEPTQPVYRNPYETTYPYFGDAPPPPPPPPKKNRHGILWAIIVTLLIISIVSLSFIGVQIYGRSTTNSLASHAVNVLPTAKIIPTPIIAIPTQVPTSTPTKQPSTHILTAVDIYNDVAPRLDQQTHHIVALGYDNNWTNWPYIPGRQAFTWHDNSTFFELAAFNTYRGTLEDVTYANNNEGQKYTALQIGTCMLMYEIPYGIGLSQDYIPLLQQEPGCN